VDLSDRRLWRRPSSGARRNDPDIRLAGKAANGGAALIGEIEYNDGCDGGKDKRGTFAVWRGPRVVSSLSR
jgi:hypothetical protein